jgi:hypothetical protein
MDAEHLVQKLFRFTTAVYLPQDTKKLDCPISV